MNAGALARWFAALPEDMPVRLEVVGENAAGEHFFTEQPLDEWRMKPTEGRVRISALWCPDID